MCMTKDGTDSCVLARKQRAGKRHASKAQGARMCALAACWLLMPCVLGAHRLRARCTRKGRQLAGCPPTLNGIGS